MIEYMLIFYICVVTFLIVFLFFTEDKEQEHDCVFSKYISCTRKHCDVKGCSISQYNIRELIKKEIENVQSGKES